MSTALLPTLQLAVPLQIEVVRDWTPEARAAFCHEHAQLVAERSDTLMFGGKRGEAASLFNTLARALACMAFNPGGVAFMGVRWVELGDPNG